MKPLVCLPLGFALLLPCGAAIIASYEFNTNGDLEGWTLPPSLNITGLGVTGGSLTGVASGNDPQLRNDSVSAPLGVGQSWDQLVFRVRETQDEAPSGTVTFDQTGLVVLLNNSGPLTFSTGFTAVDSGDGFYTVSLDISSIGTTPITAIRVDPIGGASSNSNSQTDGNTFEVDFIRVTAVPEQGVMLLGGLGLLALLRRRR